MERKICINCEEYLTERCDAQISVCNIPDLKIPVRKEYLDPVTGRYIPTHARTKPDRS